MRTLILFLLTLMLSSQVSFASTIDMFLMSNDHEIQTQSNIQDRIMNAFMNSFVVQNNSEIVALIDEISSLYDNSKNNLFLYWKGYAYYYNCIIYLKSSDKKIAQEELNKGIKALDSIETKNSEDYALLSMLYSFSCQFLGFPEVVQASKQATNCIDKALKLDENNLRTYYVLANNDYYTPETYGGGSIVEENLLKAISLPPQKNNNPYLPSWGRQESFELLTSFYLKKKDKENARKYIELGLAEYPDSYTLKYNKSKL